MTKIHHKTSRKNRLGNTYHFFKENEKKLIERTELEKSRNKKCGLDYDYKTPDGNRVWSF